MRSHDVLPVFDLDDLAFFYVYGIGLRHVDQATYEKEVVKGGHGDAVSLANFGLNNEASPYFYESIQSSSYDLCVNLQVNIERFIVGCHQQFHSVADHYKDAAYLFLMRGHDARSPYDFINYPLGKCGKARFGVDAILSSFSTCDFENDNILHANLNVFNEVIRQIRALKLRCARELRAVLLTMSDMALHCERLTDLIECYEANVPLAQPFFATLIKWCLENKDFAKHPVAEHLVTNRIFHMDSDDFDHHLYEVNRHVCKGDEPLEIAYEAFDYDAASTSNLISQLVSAIEQENEREVRAILAGLSAKGETSLMGDEAEVIIRNAAKCSNVKILEMVHDFDSVIWHEVKDARPFFHAAKYLRLESLQFLFSRLNPASFDLTLGDAHIYSSPSLCYHFDKGMDIIRLLLSKHVPIGNETWQLFKNPVATVAGSYEVKNKAEVLALLLPYANAESKYAGFIRAVLELYYLYQRGCNITPDSAETDAMFLAINMIFSSLSPAECSEIRKIFSAKKPENYSSAEEMLFRSVKFKCKVLEKVGEGVFNKIKSCFHPLAGGACLPSLGIPVTFYSAHHKESDNDDRCPRHCSLN